MTKFYSLDYDGWLFSYDEKGEVDASIEWLDRDNQALVVDEFDCIYDWCEGGEGPYGYQWVRTDRNARGSVDFIVREYGTQLSTSQEVKVSRGDWHQIACGIGSGELRPLESTYQPPSPKPTIYGKCAFPCEREGGYRWSRVYSQLLRKERWRPLYWLILKYVIWRWVSSILLLSLIVAAIWANVYFLPWYWMVAGIPIVLFVAWISLVRIGAASYLKWIELGRRLTAECLDDPELLEFARKEGIFQFISPPTWK